MGSRRKPAPVVPEQGTAETGPDSLRATDGHGNVRPADDRFLTSDQRAAKDDFVAQVTPAADKAAAQIAADLDTHAYSRPEATPVTSPELGDPDTLPTGDDA